jgi:GNAT superfamily N-acetyltransferase
LNHGAGDLGALYTMPEYRRRGLAKKVVQDRLRSIAGMGIEGYVWVVEGNTASMALWRGMGWTRGWTAEWVNLRDPRTFKSKTDP